MATSLLKTTSGTWLCPAGVTQVTVECWGGGGAGGKGGGADYLGGGGGAGGQYATKVIDVVPGSNYNYYVGTGGTATTGNGNAGNDSYWGDGSVLKAKGGAGGLSYANGGTGGQGSTTGGLGTTVYKGGNGANYALNIAGGGGGGAGNTGNGNNANSYIGGVYKNVYGGAGGNGSNVASGNGALGGTYASGGGAPTKSATPAAGRQGLVRLTFTAYISISVTKISASATVNPVSLKISRTIAVETISGRATANPVTFNRSISAESIVGTATFQVAYLNIGISLLCSSVTSIVRFSDINLIHVPGADPGNVSTVSGIDYNSIDQVALVDKNNINKMGGVQL